MLGKNSRHSIMQRKAPDTSFRLERKRNGEISTIACLQAIVFLKEIKIKISKCIYDTFTFAKAKV